MGLNQTFCPDGKAAVFLDTLDHFMASPNTSGGLKMGQNGLNFCKNRHFSQIQLIKISYLPKYKWILSRAIKWVSPDIIDIMKIMIYMIYMIGPTK